MFILANWGAWCILTLEDFICFGRGRKWLCLLNNFSVFFLIFLNTIYEIFAIESEGWEENIKFLLFHIQKLNLI
jgi:hypothetical protein